jgi:flagellar motor protein MotB
VLLAGAVVLPAAAAGPATDSPTPPSEPPVASQDQLDHAVTVFPVNGIRTFSLDGSISEVETTETRDDRTTISLATDILFEPEAWDLPKPAEDRLVELAESLPEGGVVEVTGHTDSVQGAVDNQELSENRAVAVADVLAETRPDLDLQVEGRAATDPAVQEDADDPTTRAANRRVEITFEG